MIEKLKLVLKNGTYCEYTISSEKTFNTIVYVEKKSGEQGVDNSKGLITIRLIYIKLYLCLGVSRLISISRRNISSGSSKFGTLNYFYPLD